MVELTDHPEGVLLPVRAQPGARRNAVRGEHDGALKVSVTQVAEKGKANKALIETLASELELKRSQIELVSGEAQPQKQFLIRGTSQAELAAKIAELVAE
jgi:uncharacterized protein (TIGR00251 family)